MITKTKLTSMHSKCSLKKSIVIGYLTVLQIQNKMYSMTLSVKHPIFQNFGRIQNLSNLIRQKCHTSLYAVGGDLV